MTAAATTPILISAECFDVQAQRDADRALFWRPATNEPVDLHPGDWVKICRIMECLWIRIAAIDEETVVGVVDSDPGPVRNSDLPNGTLVAIELRNIADVLRRN